MDEPWHRPVIRNHRANIFVARIERNKTSLYHRHRENTIYTVMSSAQAHAQLLGQEPAFQQYNAGDCLTGEHRIKPIIHRVRCLPESPIDAWFVGTEVLEVDELGCPSDFEHPNYEILPQVNFPGTKGYRFKLPPKTSTGVHLLNFTGLFISITDGQLLITDDGSTQSFPHASGVIERGYLSWFSGPIQVNIENNGTSEYQSVFYEFA